MEHESDAADEKAGAPVRWLGLWDAYFVVCYLVTAGLVFTSSSPQGHRALALGALTLLAVWYAGLGRPLLSGQSGSRKGESGQGGDRPGGGGRRNGVFCAGLCGLFALVAFADPAGSFALFGVVPMVMMSLPTRPAVAVAVPANLLPLVAWWWARGASSPPPLFALLASLLGVALSVLLGLWIKRVVRQNREHAELIEELRRNRAEVARLSHRAGVAAERERLAREIHDTLAQSLTSVIGLVQAVEAEVDGAPGLDRARERLALVGRVAGDALAEARAFVAGRAPAPLQESSPAQALRRQAEALAEQTGLPVRFVVEGDERPLPMAVGVVLLRAAQETLANVRKHAAAGRVEVVLRYADGHAGLVVTDDGRGFEAGDGTRAADDARPEGGFGLRGLRARVAESGGELAVVSGPGQGTVVTVRMPA
ncbi:sensor histidine kinase [Streptomyces sp. NPDC020742]|uniref:sensor histidine kinase n=1 Tax=Streptomyces sp. NPDC020742 TaxID=3154897 RepID=UPI003401EDD6